MRERIKGQGAEVLAVCMNGSADQVLAYRRARRLSLLMEAPGSGIAALYGVDRAPTTLVIDRDGRIAARWQGASEELLRKGLAAAGAALPLSHLRQ